MAAVAGAAIGIFWSTMIVDSQNEKFWYWWGGHYPYMRYIAFATCPFSEIAAEYQRNSIWVPFLNAIYYGYLAYLIMRFAKRPTIPVISILGATTAVFWVTVQDASINGFHLPRYIPKWLENPTFPFSFITDRGGLEAGISPLLNSLYWLIVYVFLNEIYRRFLKHREKIKAEGGCGLGSDHRK